MTYNVLVCPDRDCRGISIINERPETVTCRKCSKSNKFKKYHLSYTADTNEEAIKARTKLFTKLSNIDKDYDELIEEGIFEDVDKVYQQNKHNIEKKDPKKIILQCCEELDNSTRNNIIENATKLGITKRKAEETLEELKFYGEIYQDRNKNYKKL